MKRFFYFSLCMLSLTLSSCTDIDISMPKGPQGSSGLSAYELWKQRVNDGTINWPINQTEESDFFKYLKGQGGTGLSAYEQWKLYIAAGNVPNPHNPGNMWNANANSLSDFYTFLTGASGESGQTPRIGNDGNWWIGSQNTNIPARGPKGEDATPPRVEIDPADGTWIINGNDTNMPSRGAAGATPSITIDPADGTWIINGNDTNMPSKGTDGNTPQVTIGNDGFWYINNTNTNVRAYGRDGNTPTITIDPADGTWIINGNDTNMPSRGAAGATGTSPTVTIDPVDGTWIINGNDTNMPSRGAAGAAGTAGKSAYDLWKDHIKNGTVPHPQNPSVMWPAGKNTLADFWEFLRGPRGADGKDGQDGMPGEAIIPGLPNVLPIYYNGSLREYVNPEDGSVTFMVFDASGTIVGQNVVVKNLPGVNPSLTFSTDSEGKIKLTPDMLPNNLLLTQRKGSATVEIGGLSQTSAPNTFVPNRVNTRIVDEFVYPRDMTSWINHYSQSDLMHFIVIKYKYERQIDGNWESYPSTYPKPTFASVKVINHTQAISEMNIQRGPAYSRWRIPNEKFTSDFTAHKDKNILLIKRPQVLTQDEKNSAGIVFGGNYQDRLIDAKNFEWDGTKQYYTIRGESFFYGQNPLMQAAVHIPEIYPHPNITNFKAEISSGQTNLWGDVTPSHYPNFYPKYTVPSTSPRVWEAPAVSGGQLFNAPYKNTFTMRFYMVRAGGDATLTIGMSGGNKVKASFSSAYPEYMITIYSLVTGDVEGLLSNGTRNPDIWGGPLFVPYRGVPSHNLKITSITPPLLYLQNPFFGNDPSYKQQVVIENAPAEYRLMN